MSGEDDHETLRLAMLLNVLVLCLLLPTSTHVTYFGLVNIVRSERKRQRKRQKNQDSEERKCYGWPYLKLLAATALIAAFCYILSLWYWICLSPAWMRGYNKNSVAAIACRMAFNMFMYFVGNSYIFFIAFWLERLLCTFTGASVQIQVSTRTKWMLRVPLFFSAALSIVYLISDIAIGGTIVDLKSADTNPFKHSNKHPTSYLTIHDSNYNALLIFTAFVVVFENAYLGYAYFTRLKALFAMDYRQRPDWDAYVHRVAVVALVSVCSTMICFAIELLVPTFAFAVAIDAVVNSLCVVSSFSFGKKHYQLFFARFERMCPFDTATDSPQRIMSLTKQNSVELQSAATSKTEEP